MQHLLYRSMLSAVVLVALVASGTGVTFARMPDVHSSAVHAAQPCTTAVVTYIVGQPPLPQPQANGAASNAMPVRPGAYPYPYYGGLGGTITRHAYPPCGGPTGSFNVHATAPTRPYPVPYGSGQATSGDAIAMLVRGNSILSAAGSFAADPAHPSDPTRVMVSGSVTYGRYQFSGPLPQPGRGYACSPKTCLVARTVSFTSITGSLHFQGSSLTLSFLPPTATQLVVLQGRRAN